MFNLFPFKFLQRSHIMATYLCRGKELWRVPSNPVIYFLVQLLEVVKSLTTQGCYHISKQPAIARSLVWTVGWVGRHSDSEGINHILSLMADILRLITSYNSSTSLML